jgi:hypothetical protein
MLSATPLPSQLLVWHDHTERLVVMNRVYTEGRDGHNLSDSSIRNANISGLAHVGKNGQEYYDIAVRIRSYASRQQLAVSDSQRQEAIIQEFDRVLLTTLGVANMRLYEFRIQTPYKRLEKNSDTYTTMATSFQCNSM